MSNNTAKWSLVSHLQTANSASLSLISSSDNKTFTSQIFPTSENSGKQYAPWFLGLNHDKQIILFDPESKNISLSDAIPGDAVATYAYRQPNSNLMWFVNDGDKEHGNDPLNCGDKGSTITVIDKGSDTEAPKHIKTICVGHGHHVPTFISPTLNQPDLPSIVYVSNLLGGDIVVLDNDPNNDTYLSITDTINLCEPEKEKDGRTGIPNNAFPHGKQFSSVTGKIYSLNNGYGTVAVINPLTHEIESRIPLKGASNLLLSYDGKYLIGKGADRKSNPDHVIGKLSVIDVEKEKIIHQYDVEDYYPSVYRFSANGKKLYVTSAATGKDKQKNNLKINTLYVYDCQNLPELKLVKVIQTGNADCGRRPIAFPESGNGDLIFIPNPTDGTLDVINGETDELMETIQISDEGGKEFNFSLWIPGVYGA